MRPQPAAAIVVGGGAVGLGLAMLLNRLVGASARSLPVVHMAKLDTARGSKSSVTRWYSLSPGSVKWLKEQGVRLDLTNRFNLMQVDDLVGGSGFVYRAKDFGIDALGYTIEETSLLTQLDQQLKSSKQLQRAGLCSDIVRQGDLWLCEQEQGASYSAPMVFAADGAASILSARAGIDQRLQWSNSDVGIICELKVKVAQKGLARQWFSHSGVIALLPMELADKFSLVWSTHASIAEKLEQLDDAAFIQELNQATGGNANIVEISNRAYFPLNTHCATSLVKNGLVVIGNSACAIHPLAGQGLNLGLWQLARLQECIQQYGITNKALYNWQAQVLAVNYSYWMLMRQLAEVFRSTNPLTILLRNKLLSGFFSNKLIASHVIDFAMHGVLMRKNV